MREFLSDPILAFQGMIWIEFMLNMVLKASVLFTAGWAAWFLCRRASSSLRHVILMLCLSGILLLPIVSILAPSLDLSLINPLSSGEAAAAVPIDLPGTGENGGMFSAVMQNSGRPPFVLIAAAATAWLLGAALVLARLGIGAIKRRTLLQSAVEIGSPQIRREFEEIKRSLGISRGIRLLSSPLSPIPMTWGIFRPIVLLSGRSASWSRGRIRMVLAHELAHIKRLDVLTSALVQPAAVLFWFHPLVWMLMRRFYLEREYAGDDMVLNMGALPSDYARHLLEVAESLSGSRRLLPVEVAMAHASCLEGRVLSILDKQTRRRSLGWAGILAAALFFGGILIPVAGIQTWGGGEEEQQNQLAEMRGVNEVLQTFRSGLDSRDLRTVVALFSDSYFGGTSYEEIRLNQRRYIEKLKLTWFEPYPAIRSDLKSRQIKKIGSEYLVWADFRFLGLDADGTAHQVSGPGNWVFRLGRENRAWKILNIYVRPEQAEESTANN